MTTISERFNTTRTVGAVLGLELEIEGSLPDRIPGDLWSVKQDGSLRGGLEYVFSRPLGSARAKEALEVLEEHFKTVKAEPSYSFRTSTHCHVNVSNLELDEVKAIVVLYYLFEDYYINFCAPSRRHNRFCLTMQDATGICHLVNQFLTDERLPDNSRGKYSALNLCTLGTFGTLEFRALEGTNDWNRVFTWIRAIMALRKAGKHFGSVQAIMKASPRELLDQMFPTERLAEKFVDGNYETIWKNNRKLMWDSIGKFI